MARSWICVGDMWSDGCGRVLTDDERHYYETCCESCCREGLDRVLEWKRGGGDQSLDEMFDGPATTIN